MKPSEYPLNDPIAAIATALSPAAIALVRTSGKGCIELASHLFSRPQAIVSAKGNTIVHAWLRDGETMVDEVLVSVFRAPKSFTGEDSLEISVHGGIASAIAAYRLLLRSGFREAQAGEFTFRAFVNGKTDLARAEAVREIIGSQTDTARESAAQRLSGALSREIHGVRDRVARALAAIEVEIEYPEDEETTAGAFDTALIEEALSRLETLENTWAAEKIIQDGAKLVLAGSTNAGKSSLFNALLKQERSIVSDIHGTTRDFIESLADFHGIPVRLFDTAGLRETGDRIEAEGVERSLALVGRADIVVYMVDSTLGLSAEDLAFLRSRTEGSAYSTPTAPLVIAWNKAEKDGSAPPPPKENLPGVHAVLKVSAKKGDGIADLVEAIVNVLTLGRKTEGVSLGSERQKNAVRDARLSLSHSLSAAKQGFPMDAIAQDLEDTLDSLGEITGETSGQDILDLVFSAFCVGK